MPNQQQENVFMAVAMDLADDKSPYGSIHPRDKADVAERLVLGARAIIFNESVYWTGPIFDKALVCQSFEGPQNIIVYYKEESVPVQGIEIVSLDGFEVCQYYYSHNYFLKHLKADLFDIIIVNYSYKYSKAFYNHFQI